MSALDWSFAPSGGSNERRHLWRERDGGPGRAAGVPARRERGAGPGDWPLARWQEHTKLREVLVKDLFDVPSYASELTGLDACFFCLGVSSAGMSEAAYRHLTYDLTVAVAQELAARNSALCFVYVSGAGTDSQERGRTHVGEGKRRGGKRAAEMPFRSAFMFRPGMIQPLDGIRSKTRAYRLGLCGDGAGHASAAPRVSEFGPDNARDWPGDACRSAQGLAATGARGEGHSAAATRQP